MIINETEIYRFAFENRYIFPAGIYSLDEIYWIFTKYVFLPEHHKLNRPDIAYPKWKNYIHTVRPTIERIEYIGNMTYLFH